MANDGFNGATLVFGAHTLTNKILGMNYSAKAAAVDVTPANVTDDIFEPGTVKKELSVDLVGSVTGLSAGEKGALVVVWPDGISYGSIASALLTDLDKKGNKNGALGMTLKFCPAATV
jgi:hypothetical protein